MYFSFILECDYSTNLALSVLYTYFQHLEIMENFLEDAHQLQQTYLMLLKNQSQLNVWMSRVLHSAMEVITKVL